MASNWAWPKLAKGATGARFCKASAKSSAAKVVRSIEDVFGM
jgi:hypothetical protein